MILKSGSVRVALLFVLALLGVAPACTPLGGAPGRVGGVYDRVADIYGEIRGVDTRRDRIYVSVGRDRTRTVYYDRWTRVYDGRRSYPVSALRRGDDVRIRVVYDRRGRAWADRVEIRRGWGWHRDGRWDDRWDHRRWGDRDDDDDRRHAHWQVGRWTGRVRAVEVRRGFFTLERSPSQVVVVRIRDLRDDDARRLERLRRGDRVTVEVRYRDGNDVELIRFR